MPPRVLSLTDQARHLDAPWSPRILAEPNSQVVKLARTEGDFVWHQHDDGDELFLVVEGRLEIDFEDGTVALEAGQLCLVPRGLRHRPRGEALILLVEAATTRNTGEVEHALTRDELERA